MSVTELRHVTALVEKTITPRKIHFVLVADAYAECEISLAYYIAIKSAMAVNPGYECFLHTNLKPTGAFWSELSDRVRLVPCHLPNEVFGRPITLIHHKADVLRLQLLLEHGGIYLDLDTICLRSFEPLLKSVSIMGFEGAWSLCNAVILAPPQAEFIVRWLEEYRGFHNDQWNEFSSLLPKRLADEYPELVELEPQASFFLPCFWPEDLVDLFERTKSYPDAYVHHLWTTASKGYLERISIADIMSRDCTYNLAARPLVAELAVEAKTGSRLASGADPIADYPNVFEDIYQNDAWGAGSGNGSNPAYTSSYRALVEEFILHNNIRSVVDIGCGDWQSTRFINFNGASYTGFDVVRSLVDANRVRFGVPGVTFEYMPDDASQLPAADMLILKDVLQHLPDWKICTFRDHVLPRYRFCLITNSWQCVHAGQNGNIESGAFRSLDLTKQPYAFPGAYIHEMWNPWERIRTMLVINPGA